MQHIRQKHLARDVMISERCCKPLNQNKSLQDTQDNVVHPGQRRLLLEQNPDMSAVNASSKTLSRNTRRLLQHDRDPYAADAMAGAHDQHLSWDDFPVHTDGLGGVDDWHDRSVVV